MRDRIDEADAGGSILGRVIEEAMNYAVGPERQTAGRPGDGESGVHAAEVGLRDAASRARAAVVAAESFLVIGRQHGAAADGHQPLAPELILDPLLHDPLGAVHLHRRQESTIRKVRQRNGRSL